MVLDHSLHLSSNRIVLSKWQTMQISGDTAHFELSRLNLPYLKKHLIAFCNERVKWICPALHLEERVHRQLCVYRDRNIDLSSQ